MKQTVRHVLLLINVTKPFICRINPRMAEANDLSETAHGIEEQIKGDGYGRRNGPGTSGD